ncbi:MULTISPECIES: putative sporulation protein YtxC [unclassified Romboutsia]|uniref:putative sporulation protein YtxC n=1 Tax=unclassified Romboutsia TaxID=2626894 RepID=UPI000821920A|nr:MULTISPECIES: putative sporulation protein YtxC [unclassified Romboutsia]SCH99281.1 putative sporulation protein YtxC [uncultured Clostridium sp.]
MTNKEIHISFSPHPRIKAQEILESKEVDKNVSLNGGMVELVINLDMKNDIDLEEIGQEITDLIICIVKDKYLKEYIDKRYKDSYLNELDIIYQYSLEVFNRMENLIKDSILTKVSNYLKYENYINIEGFLKFRLKEVIVYLSSIIEIAIEEYQEEKDQSEFINVLKYFVDMQDTKIDLLVVNILEDKTFKLYDSQGKKIDNLDNEDIINMVIKEELNYEDFLISTLLALCPRKIKILDYLNDNSSKLVIETIKSIFEERVSVISKYK